MRVGERGLEDRENGNLSKGNCVNNSTVNCEPSFSLLGWTAMESEEGVVEVVWRTTISQKATQESCRHLSKL